jgi:hypothetical protein
MRRLVLASTLVITAVLTGCSSPTIQNGTSPISITTSSPGLVHLEAGGLAIRSRSDTAINFDLVSHVSVKNDSSAPLHLFAEWKMQSSAGSVPIETIGTTFTPIASDTMDLGVVAPGSSASLDSIPIVTFSNSDLHGGQLDYTLQFQIQGGPVLALDYIAADLPLATATDYNLSVPIDKQYRGFIHTTEASPNPIDTLDGPEDGDWIGDSNLTLSPAYPNPTNGITEGSFTIPGSFTNPETLDSVRGDIHITPHHIVRSLSVIQPKSGVHATQFDLSGLSSGLYRLVWTAYKNGVVFTGHGDIMVPLQ